MKNYSYLEALLQSYRNNQDDLDFQKLNKKFLDTLKKYAGDPNVTSELLQISNEIRLISNGLSFEDGFRYGLQMAKECGLI